MTDKIPVNVVETPLMKQYNAIKVKYPDALLLFRVGDFYETFGEDAIKASKILGIVLTRLIFQNWFVPDKEWLFATSLKTRN